MARVSADCIVSATTYVVLVLCNSRSDEVSGKFALTSGSGEPWLSAKMISLWRCLSHSYVKVCFYLEA